MSGYPRHLVSVVLLLLLTGVCSAQGITGKAQLSVTIPDTPAGQQFAAWLAAFNSGRREAISEFIAKHFDKPPAGSLPVDEIAERNLMTFRETGGFHVRKITASSSAAITVLVEGKLTGYWMQIQFFVKAQPPDYIAQPPYHVAGIGFSNLEAPPDMLPRKKLGEQEIRDKVGDLMTKLVAAARFSGTILVAKQGRAFYQQAFGPANRAWKAQNRLDTKFNLASMTKMFTAVAIAQLVEQGKLSYEDRVGKILPDHPNKEVAERVTVRHLLTHTSGLPSANSTAEKLLTSLRQGARTVTEHLLAFINDPLQFEPGARFDYSNYGYILLGAIIEKASGQNYYTYIREHVFQPAGMFNSDFYELDSDPPNLATGFMDAPQGTRRSNALFIGVRGMPAGGAYSTVQDLLKFASALRGHKLLSAKATAELWRGSERNAHYGSGFEVKRYNGTRIIGHGGGWFGITNRMDIYPDLGYTVIILSNYDSDPTAIAHKLREWLTQSPANELPRPPAFKLTASVSPETVERGRPVSIVVTVENSGGSAQEQIIDMEIKDASGAKVEQQFTVGESLSAGERKTYTYSWTPTAAGVFAVGIGIFGDNWATKHIFINAAASVTVK